MGYIYLITNTINNKKYIGQTKVAIEQRWKQHVYAALNELDDFYFHRAIRKYGVDNFTIDELLSCNNSELDYYEKYYIDKYQTYYIYNHGYNLTRGGLGFSKINEAYILSEWNEGKSAIEIARTEGVYIRTITNVLKQYGISQTEIYSRSLKYGARFRKKRIYQYNYIGDLINVYEDIDQLHDATGYNKDYIMAACRHVYSSANGYIWQYEDDDTDIEELIQQVIKHNKIFPVSQYTLDGEYITTYKSCSSAAKFFNCDKSLIAKAVKSINNTAMGYIWKNALSDDDVMIKVEAIKNNHKYKSKKIAQIDKNTLKIIKIYNSITDAAKALNKENSRSSISKVCQGLQDTSCGYKWQYVEE